MLVFVVLRASAIEWYIDEVTARTAGPNIGELTLNSRSVVHEESRPSAPPRKGSPAVSGGGGATPLLRLVSGGRELQLEADSEPAMREWLEGIRARLSALGADANNPKPPAPPPHEPEEVWTAFGQAVAVASGYSAIGRRSGKPSALAVCPGGANALRGGGGPRAGCVAN